jgi:hypothetical protein
MAYLERGQGKITGGDTMTRQISYYLDFKIPRLQRWMADYNEHRAAMICGEVSGDVAIERAITLAGMVESDLREIAWYMEQGYESTDPMPIDILMELESRELV